MGNRLRTEPAAQSRRYAVLPPSCSTRLSASPDHPAAAWPSSPASSHPPHPGASTHPAHASENSSPCTDLRLLFLRLLRRQRTQPLLIRSNQIRRILFGLRIRSPHLPSAHRSPPPPARRRRPSHNRRRHRRLPPTTASSAPASASRIGRNRHRRQLRSQARPPSPDSPAQESPPAAPASGRRQGATCACAGSRSTRPAQANRRRGQPSHQCVQIKFKLALPSSLRDGPNCNHFPYLASHTPPQSAAGT